MRETYSARRGLGAWCSRIRPSHYGPGTCDVVLGNIRTVDEIAALVGFDRDVAA